MKLSKEISKDFLIFQLTETEFYDLRSQFAMSNETNHNDIRYLPYALTEQGIMKLFGLLNSDIAVKVNVQIIDAYTLLLDLFGSAKEEIITIDNYASKELFKVLKILISKNF